MMSNRGIQVYPAIAGIKPDTVDHWRARFFLKDPHKIMTDADVFDLVAKVGQSHRWMHIEKLNEFNHAPGFTKAQGQE